jgi:hypothetical protein
MLFRRSPFRRGDDLRRCPACRSRLVCPISWEECDEKHWHIDMRCGDCGERWERIIDDARAAKFDIELDSDVAVIRRMLDRLDLDRMAVEADTFTVALERDLIGPLDFAGSS